MKTLESKERLVINLNTGLSRERNSWHCSKIEAYTFIRELKNLEVFIKVGPILRVLGYEFIDMIHDSGLKVFADLNLYSDAETLETDAHLLKQFRPEIVSVVISTGLEALDTFRNGMFGQVEILGFGVPASMPICYSNILYKPIMIRNRAPAFMMLAGIASTARLNGVICSAEELGDWIEVDGTDGMSVNVYNVEPEWKGLSQNGIMTPAKALTLADRVIIDSDSFAVGSIRDNVMRTIGEIDEAMKCIEFVRKIKA